MHPSVSTSQRSRRWAALLALVQVVLLASSLAFAPALVIAQESPDPSPRSESAELQTHSEPSADDNATSPSTARSEPQPEPDPAEPTLDASAPAEPPRELFVHPETLKMTLGEGASVRAWHCLADAKPPFGEDKEPGTLDDTCRDVEADWSVSDPGIAELARDEAARSRVTAIAVTEGTKLIAQRGDQVARADLVIAPAPDPNPEPEAGAPDPATEDDRVDQDAARPDETKPDEAKPDESTPDESAPDESKAVEAEAAPPSRAPDAEGVGAPEPEASVEPVDEALEQPVSGAPSPPPATDAGDGGLPDALPPNVVTLAAAVDIDGNGLLDDLVTLESPPGTVLHDVTAVPVPTDPAPPEGLVFPAGLFDYLVDVVNPGDPAEVTFHLPDGVVGPDEELEFWVLQDGEWSDLTPSAEVDTVSDQVTGELVDGGAGDADGIADGVIDDPSGPAIVLAASDSTITARVWGDRLGNGDNQPLPGIVMSLWKDDGDGRFEPRGADVFIAGCDTGADGTCSFPGLATGKYWVQQVAAPGDTWFAIQTWAPGDSSRANPSVAYAASRYRDPAGGGPISVDGTNAKTTDWFAARRSNPDISDISCQQLMRIVLVLDRSGSIQSNNPTFYKNAVTGFVQDLVGTNTEIAVVSFAESASTDLGYQSVLGGNIDPILNAINSVYNRLGGGTNWDRGLFEVDGFGINPDLVLMVTDGNPTLSRSSGDASRVNWGDFTEAVTSANLIKSGGGSAPTSRIIAVAAGAAGSISIDGLVGITGRLTNQPDALDDDYVLGTPDELAARLREIALARCGASVKVKKEVETTPGQWDPGIGWSFDAEISPQTKVTPVPPADTDAGGLIAFEWISAGDRTVTITERNVAPATDYKDPTITCWDGPDFAGNVLADGNPGDGPRSITITVPTDTDFSCLFRNRPEPVEQVVRKYNDKNGDGERQSDSEPLIDTWTFWLDLDLDGIQDAGEPTRSTKDGEATFSLLPTATYQVCEVTKDDWINTDPGDASVSQRAPCKSTELIEPGRQPDAMRFGNTKPEPVDQVVRKYNDKNGDGRRQAETEPLLDGWTFWLDLDLDGIKDFGEPRKTTEDGKVVFSVLPTRPYWVCEITQDGWINTDPGSRSVSPSAPCKDAGVLRPKKDAPILQFGNTKPTPVDQLVRKYNDKNGDGRRQSETEPLIDTWTFWLDVNRDGLLGVDEPTRTTDGGEVTFSLLPDAEYWICEVTQLGWINSEPGVASLSPAAPCQSTGLIEPDSDPAVVRFGNYATDLAIEKSAEPDWFDEVGDTITYTITATNTSDGPLTGVTVSDPLLDRLPGWSCSPTLPATLAPGQSVVCSAVYTVTAADLAAGSVPNTACADSVETDPICNSVNVPAISLDVKKAANRDRIPVTDLGVPVAFTFTVTNTSEVPVEIRSLTDSDFGVLDGDSDCQVGTVLQPGESCSFEATFRLTPEGTGSSGPLPHENTFRACVTPPDTSIAGFALASGDPVCDRDDAVVTFYRPDTGGGSGTDTGGGGDQPPTDMLLPTVAASSSPLDTGPLGGTTGWILWVLMTAAVILSGGWVIRRVRYSGI